MAVRRACPSSGASRLQLLRQQPRFARRTFSTAPRAADIAALASNEALALLQKQIEMQIELQAQNTKSTKLAVLGVPMACGQPLDGTDAGPAIARERGLLGQLEALGYDTVDDGDIAVPGSQDDDPVVLSRDGTVIKNAWSVGETTRKLFLRSSALLSAGRLPVVVGGDHSLGTGSVAAALAANADTGVLWVDAHADLHTPESSPSMNMHGMPLGLLTGLCRPADIVGFEWLDDPQHNIPKLKPERLVYVGLRDVDHAEKVMLKQLGITAFTMRDVDKYGIAHVMDLAMAQLAPSAEAPLHVSFDIDAVCPTWAPATGTTVAGGLSFREANYVTEAVAETGALGSLDMVEVNPTLGQLHEDAAKTADLGNMLITSMLGDSII